jgi:hypothetical protein
MAVDFKYWWPAVHGRVAVVGNGPLTAEFGDKIDGSALVARINFFAGGRKTGWRTDLAFLHASVVADPRLPKLPPVTVAVASSGEVRASVSRDPRISHVIGPERLAELRRRVGVDPEKELLTGLVAAVEFVDRGWQVDLYGCDFFSGAERYETEASGRQTGTTFESRHDLGREASFLGRQAGIQVHG